MPHSGCAMAGTSKTLISVFGKAILYPASHKVPIDKREHLCNAGTICAFPASMRSIDRSNSPIWVECMRSPFGFWMVIGFCAMRWLSTGHQSKLIYVEVAPEPAMIEKGGHR
jgi:hypothetical protein